MAAKYIYDPLLGKGVLHDHADKLGLSGGTLTGDLTFPVTGYLMVDSNGAYWRVTIGTDGALTTTSETYIPNALMTELGEYLLTEAGEYLIQQ